MPAVKIRNPFIAQSLKTASPIHVDLVYTAQEFFLAGASRIAGSILNHDLSGSMNVVAFPGASSTCPLWVAKPTPLNVALSGAAAGSGTVYVDWTNTSSNDATATFTGSLLWIPPGSALADVGACTLGSGCATLTGTTACEINTGSLFQFKTPPDRTGLFALRMIVNTKDNSTTACPAVVDYRVRYNADRIGS